MGQFIANTIKVTVFLALLSGIGWFIAFSTNPGLICVDHPTKKLRKTHYQCKPFGITVEKPEPEKKFRDGKF